MVGSFDTLNMLLHHGRSSTKFVSAFGASLRMEDTPQKFKKKKKKYVYNKKKEKEKDKIKNKDNDKNEGDAVAREGAGTEDKADRKSKSKRGIGQSNNANVTYGTVGMLDAGLGQNRRGKRKPHTSTSTSGGKGDEENANPNVTGDHKIGKEKETENMKENAKEHKTTVQQTQQRSRDSRDSSRSGDMRFSEASIDLKEIDRVDLNAILDEQGNTALHLACISTTSCISPADRRRVNLSVSQFSTNQHPSGFDSQGNPVRVVLNAWGEVSDTPDTPVSAVSVTFESQSEGFEQGDAKAPVKVIRNPHEPNQSNKSTKTKSDKNDKSDMNDFIYLSRRQQLLDQLEEISAEERALKCRMEEQAQACKRVQSCILLLLDRGVCVHAANHSGASAIHYLCANRVFNAYEHKGFEATHHTRTRRHRRNSMTNSINNMNNMSNMTQQRDQDGGLQGGEEEEEEEYVESGFAEPLLALIANHVNNNVSDGSDVKGCRELANSLDNFSTTPLLVAILHRQWGIARFLLQNGADMGLACVVRRPLSLKGSQLQKALAAGKLGLLEYTDNTDTGIDAADTGGTGTFANSGEGGIFTFEVNPFFGGANELDGVDAGVGDDPDEWEQYGNGEGGYDNAKPAPTASAASVGGSVVNPSARGDSYDNFDNFENLYDFGFSNTNNVSKIGSRLSLSLSQRESPTKVRSLTDEALDVKGDQGGREGKDVLFSPSDDKKAHSENRQQDSGSRVNGSGSGGSDVDMVTAWDLLPQKVKKHLFAYISAQQSMPPPQEQEGCSTYCAQCSIRLSTNHLEPQARRQDKRIQRNHKNKNSFQKAATCSHCSQWVCRGQACTSLIPVPACTVLSTEEAAELLALLYPIRKSDKADQQQGIVGT